MRCWNYGKRKTGKNLTTSFWKWTIDLFVAVKSRLFRKKYWVIGSNFYQLIKENKMFSERLNCFISQNNKGQIIKKNSARNFF